MTQYARPDADTSVGSWDNSEEDATDLFDYVNESDDNTYIYVEGYGGADTIVFSLGEVDAPDSGTRTVTVRASEGGGMDGVSLAVTLKEGSTSKGSATFDEAFGSIADLSFNITSSISDYSNLNLTIAATDTMGMGTVTKIYNAYLSIPDAAAAEATTSPAFLLFVD
jgi:hypothetical protein